MYAFTLYYVLVTSDAVCVPSEARKEGDRRRIQRKLTRRIINEGYFLFSRGKLIPCFSLVRSLARWILRVLSKRTRKHSRKHSQKTHTHTLERLMSSESISRLISRKQVAHSDTVAQEFKRRSHDANDEHRDFSVVGFIFVVDASGRGVYRATLAARHGMGGK